jgi:drug/metabolite transporter (DMT)-like permease
LLIRGIEIIGSNRGGVFINIVPIFAAGLAILLLGEQFRLYHALAIILVLSGVWVAQKQKPTPGAPPGG